MRKLIISFVFILMFAFSLNKLNPVKEEKNTNGIKKVPFKKDCFVGITCMVGYYLSCDFRCNCKCVLYKIWPFIKPSKSTKGKINKQN